MNTFTGNQGYAFPLTGLLPSGLPVFLFMGGVIVCAFTGTIPPRLTVSDAGVNFAFRDGRDANHPSLVPADIYGQPPHRIANRRCSLMGQSHQDAATECDYFNLLRPTVSGAGANFEASGVSGSQPDGLGAYRRGGINNPKTRVTLASSLSSFEASGVEYASGGKSEGAMSSCIARPLASFVL